MASDRSSLADILDDDASRFASFYPEEEPAPEPTTNSTIDEFLNRYGSNCEKETEALENILSNPIPVEYTFSVDDDIEDSNYPKTEQDSLIDSFQIGRA